MQVPPLIVQLSDLHLRAGDLAAGQLERLRRAVSAIADIQPAPLALILSGDLADEPDAGAYESARETVAQLGLPVHVIPGNHDDRAMLADCFALAPAPDGSLRFVASHGGLRLIGLDSTLPGALAGALGSEQLEWLERTLAQEPATPTLLVLHHPPLATGIAVMDRIALDAEDSARLEELLAAHPQVLTVACGHVHAAMTSSFAGRALVISPALSSTVRLDLRPDDSIDFCPVALPVGFAVHALVHGRLVSYVRPLETLSPQG